MGNRVLGDILLERTNIIEVIIIAFFLAFGVNLVSGNLSELGIEALTTFWLGIFICVFVLVYMCAKLMWQKTKHKRISGFIVYDEKENKIVNVPRYPVSEEIHECIEAAFHENTALRVLWENEPLGNMYKIHENTERDQEGLPIIKIGSRLSKEIVREALEYCLLTLMDTTLTDYFNEVNFDNKKLKVFSREEIPGSILKNRFLDLFSKAMEERPLFVEQTLCQSKDGRKPPGKVVASYHVVDGVKCKFELFELTLPEGSKMIRNSDNTIEIRTNRFTIEVDVKFDGMGALLPRGFKNHYLKIDNRIRTFSFDVDIKVKFKFGTLFSFGSWVYYKWIDLLLEKVEEEMSAEKFFTKIDWEKAYTILYCLENDIKTIRKMADMEKQEIAATTNDR